MDKVILVSKISSLGKGGKILFILSLVCVLVLPANSEITATDPTIYWSMDSLFGYQQGDPTVVTNCISGSCNNCISGSCIKFDGSSGILVGTSGTTNSPIQNKATYSLWIKTPLGHNTPSLVCFTATSQGGHGLMGYQLPPPKTYHPPSPRPMHQPVLWGDFIKLKQLVIVWLGSFTP